MQILDARSSAFATKYALGIDYLAALPRDGTSSGANRSASGPRSSTGLAATFHVTHEVGRWLKRWTRVLLLPTGSADRRAWRDHAEFHDQSPSAHRTKPCGSWFRCAGVIPVRRRHQWRRN